MKLWSAWSPHVMPSVAGCSNPMLEQEARSAAIEFFHRTHAWSVWLTSVASVDGRTDYTLAIPAESEVVLIDKATIDGSPLEILSYREADQDWTGTELDQTGVLSSKRTTFSLGQNMGAGRAIKIRITLKPSEASTGIPDELFSQYRPDISHGIKAALMLVPGYEFSNASLSTYHRGLFDGAIATRTAEAWRGNTAKTPRAKVTWC